MTYSKEEKAMRLEDWRRSGKSAWTYAKENGLIPKTFFGWTRKEKKQPAGFVEIRPEAAAPFQERRILIERGDIKIHIPAGLSGGELGAVVEILRAAI